MEVKDIIVAEHEREYSVFPEAVAKAPGRFHFAGEHTWFFKDKTLSMAVNIPVYVAASLNNDNIFRFHFVQLDERKKSSIASLKLKKEDKWANSIKAVLFGFQAMNCNLRGMDFTIYSEILPSAGFGITTAIKVASSWVIKELCGYRFSQEKVMSVLEKANRKFLSTDDHKADSFAAICSKENHVVLTDYSDNSCELIPFKFKDKTIILTDAKVPRVETWNEESLMQPENVLLLGELKELRSNVHGGWMYDESKANINEVLSVVSEETKRRLTCTMVEHRNVLDCVNAIQKEDFDAFAKAVNRSHEAMRDLYEISCPEIDWILKRVHGLDEKPDNLRTQVNCGRITGKGFGRCLYAVLRTSDVPKYKEKLDEYSHIFGFNAECYEVKPAKGVRLI